MLSVDMVQSPHPVVDQAGQRRLAVIDNAFGVCGAVVMLCGVFVDADTPVRAPTEFALLSGVTDGSVRTGQQELSA